MKVKSNRIKYVFTALGIIFLIVAFLLFLAAWEAVHGKFRGVGTYDDVITYEGREYVPKDNIETLLVLGLDKYKSTTSFDSYNNDKQADFLMLFVFDNNTKTCSAIHINRDTMTKVRILAVDETKIVDTVTKQIALAHTYGSGKETSCRNTKDSVEDLLLGINVNHYISFTMDSVAAINDFVGGVEVTVQQDFTDIDSSLIKGKTVTLMGEQALNYVRERYGLEDSSNSTRMERQRQYINALYDRAMSYIDTDSEFTIKLIEKMNDYVVYDSSDHKMLKFAEKLCEYEFIDIRVIEGESRLGEEFVEFYPDANSVHKIVLDLFYKLKS